MMQDLQAQIIDQMGVKPSIQADKEVRRSIDFIKAYFKHHPFLKTTVLGVSGGQDSTLVGKLCQLAMEELRKEEKDDRYQFIAIHLPYGEQADLSDVKDAFDWIQPDRRLTINIKSSVDALVAEFQDQLFDISDFNKGNIKARMRMTTQFAVAGGSQGVVVGTDHAAENVVGFFTKFGDGSADLMPLFRLNKRQGRQMLEQLGAPDHLIYKVPTADLEDDQPMQADEEALGVTYDAIDDYLEGKKIDPQDQERIESLYLNSQHKRHMPITVFDDFWKSEENNLQ